MSTTPYSFINKKEKKQASTHLKRDSNSKEIKLKPKHTHENEMYIFHFQRIISIEKRKNFQAKKKCKIQCKKHKLFFECKENITIKVTAKHTIPGQKTTKGKPKKTHKSKYNNQVLK